MKTSPNCLACYGEDTVLWATARDAEYLTVKDLFQYYRCAQCDALSIDPVPRERLNEIYPNTYYSFVEPQHSFVLSVKNWLDERLFKKILNKLPGNSLSVLDVGGGAGWQLNNLRNIDSRIKKTYLVDLDQDAEKLARANGHEYFCGGIEQYKTEIKFDLIVMLNLIEHVGDPLFVLKKIRSMLHSKGIAIIKTPNYDALDARIFRHTNWAGYHCPRHWVLFTKKSFAMLVEQAGLCVEEFSYTQGASFWAASILFWMERRRWISITKERPVGSHPLFGIFSMIFAAFDFIRRPFVKTSQMFFILGVKTKD